MNFNFKKLQGEQSSDISNYLKDKKNFIDLGVGDPNFKIPKKEYIKKINSINSSKISYTYPTGLESLKKKILLKENKLKIESKNIVITPGGKTGIFYAFLILNKKNTEALIPDIGFPTYNSMAKYTGMKIQKYKMKKNNQFYISAENIISKINSKTRLIIINSPHNPTGVVMNDNEMVKLANFLKNKKIYLISDEVYSDLVFIKKKYKSFGQFKFLRNNLVILNGWSKNFGMTGWRIGWSYWPNKFIKYINLLCINNNTCPSFISQKVIEQIILKKKFIKNHILDLKKKLSFVKKKIFINYSIEGAIYLFLKIPKLYKNDIKYCKKLIKKNKIAVIPGSSFGNSSKKYIRINFSKKIKFLKKFINIYKKDLCA